MSVPSTVVVDRAARDAAFQWLLALVRQTKAPAAGIDHKALNETAELLSRRFGVDEFSMESLEVVASADRGFFPVYAIIKDRLMGMRAQRAEMATPGISAEDRYWAITLGEMITGRRQGDIRHWIAFVEGRFPAALNMVRSKFGSDRVAALCASRNDPALSDEGSQVRPFAVELAVKAALAPAAKVTARLAAQKPIRSVSEQLAALKSGATP